MKKTTKRVFAALICLIMTLSFFSVSVLAANYDTNYGKYPVPTRALYYKSPTMKGDDVRWFQCAINYLITYGDKNGSKLSTSKLDVDGSFGPACKTATKAFQKKYGLSQDGSFGPASRAKMLEVLPSNTNSLKWLWPTTVKTISCVFADVYYHTSHWHRGIDIPCSQGTNVYASRSGTMYTGNDSSRGYYVVIDHGDGYYSEYQHLKANSYKFKSGSKVNQGDVIALSGNTGAGTGAHLHFEVMNLGKSGLGKSYTSYWGQGNKYVNVNPKNSSAIAISNSNVIKVSKASSTPTADPKKSNGYVSDSYGIEYFFKG